MQHEFGLAKTETIPKRPVLAFVERIHYSTALFSHGPIRFGAFKIIEK
jgi:hypothetical protein